MIEKLSAEILRKHKGVSFTGITTCFFCHDGAGKVFMAKRSHHSRDEQGKWDVGGGGLKWGLSAEDNVRREIEEEYGTKPLEIQFLGYRDAFRELPDSTQTHWIALDFLARVDRNDVHISEPDMFDDSGWFTMEELPEPIHSQLPHAFAKYEPEFRAFTS